MYLARNFIIKPNLNESVYDEQKGYSYFVCYWMFNTEDYAEWFSQKLFMKKDSEIVIGYSMFINFDN